MSLSKEINDFTDGFTQGYKIWSDIDTRKETKLYHEKLEAHWLADSRSSGKNADEEAAKAAGKTALGGFDPNKDLGGGTTGGGGGNKPQLTPDILNDPDKMRGFIHQAESKGNYNATVYMTNGKPGPTANLTDMTLEQVQAYQKDMLANGHASTAVGAGQYIAPTLNGLINTLGLDRKTTKFTPEVQNQLTDELLRQHGYDDYKKNGDATPFLTSLSREWASLPDPHTGLSHYHNQNGNAATVGYATGVFKTAPTPLPGAVAERARPLAQPTTAEAGQGSDTWKSADGTTYSGPTAQRAAGPGATQVQPSGQSAKPPVIPPAPAIKPSMATPDAGTTSTPRADLDPSQIPVPTSLQASAPGAAAIPPSTSPVELASAQSPWAIPGYPNPMAQMAGGGLVTPQPQGSRYDSGSQVAESVPPPHGLTVYATGGNVMPPQLQAGIQESLPGYAAGGAVEPEEENTEGDTSPVSGFDPNTPVEVAGYDGKFTAAQAAAASDEDDSTPGTDEYWAAVRRQQASRTPQQAPATPSQDPQLTSSRPPGQAIPVTGSQAPGDTGQPTSFFDFVGRALGGIADAVHGGLMGLSRMLGLSSAIPSGAPVDPAATQKLAAGEGKYSPEELKAIDKAVGIPDNLTPALQNVVRLYAGYHYYEQKGDMVSANKYAGSMLATIQESIRMDGTMALLAGKHGDVAMMAKKLADAHDKFPNGDTMKVSDVSKDGANYEIIGPDGRVSESGRATIDDMMKLATNTSNGTEFFKQAGYLGGKSTPQQIEKDKADRLLEDYNKSPGPMTAMEQQWRAGKSPEQLAAFDQMDWKTKQALVQKEMQEKKVTDDQQNQQEASRLMGLEQEAKNEIAAAQAQRPNRFVQTNDEKAAWDKLQGVQKAISGWAAASPGRWNYLRPLEAGLTSSGKSTGVGVTTPGAIPPAGGGRQTPKQAQEAQDDADQYAKDQAERVGVLRQEQFSNEGKPLGGTRAKTAKDYQDTLALQGVQKTYDESGAAKAPKKADLEKISSELTAQSPHLDDPGNAPLKQRFGQAAATVMNNNDVTANDAVGIVKAATELDKDGKPKVQIAYTRDGRVRVGDYQPMIVTRETLTQLGNLAQLHARAKGTQPNLQIDPAVAERQEQDLQASQTGLGLRPRSPADAGPPADRAAATVPGTPGPAHGLWGELPPSPASPMSPDERDEASRSARGFRPLGMVQDLMGGKIPSAPPMEPPPTESPPGGFRPFGMVQDMFSPARRQATSPGERDEASAPSRAIPPQPPERQPSTARQDYVAQRKGAIDAQRRVSDIGVEARRQSERSGAGKVARDEDAQEVSRLATKGTMRAEAARRAVEAAKTVKPRRVAIPAAGS